MLWIDDGVIANKIIDQYDLPYFKHNKYFLFNTKMAITSELFASVQFWYLPKIVELEYNQIDSYNAYIPRETRKKQIYFAYGSNMDVNRLRNRLSSSNTIHQYCASLSKYRIEFNKQLKNGTGAANIMKYSKRTVHIIAYFLSLQDLYIIDYYEGVEKNHYRRENVLITIKHNHYEKKHSLLSMSPVKI